MSANKTGYVVGFLFRNEGSEVALILKNKPAWQLGQYNGIGGKIETFDQSPWHAMAREFQEETGALVEAGDWREFAVMHWRDAKIHFFTATRDVALQSITEEKVGWYSVAHDLPKMPLLKNLKWLVPMASDPDGVHAVVGDPS